MTKFKVSGQINTYHIVFFKISQIRAGEMTSGSRDLLADGTLYLISGSSMVERVGAISINLPVSTINVMRSSLREYLLWLYSKLYCFAEICSQIGDQNTCFGFRRSVRGEGGSDLYFGSIRLRCNACQTSGRILFTP
jgi:hypothetical protein